MRFGTLTGTLLLGVALSASSSVLAAEIAAPAERLGGSGSTSRPSAAKDVPNSQKQRMVEKAKLEINDTQDTEMALKKSSASADNRMGGAEEAIPGNIPPAEPQSFALRGVRG